MTKEEKQIIAIEIDKYFRSKTMDKDWFSDHLKSTIELPEEAIVPQGISNVIINEESIEPVNPDIYCFSATASVCFKDRASGINVHSPVKMDGCAEIGTRNERTFVKDIVITSLVKS